MLAVEAQHEGDHGELGQEGGGGQQPVGGVEFVDHARVHEALVDEEVDHHRHRNAGANQSVGAGRGFGAEDELAEIALTAQHEQTGKQNGDLCREGAAKEHHGFARRGMGAEGGVQAM